MEILPPNEQADIRTSLEDALNELPEHIVFDKPITDRLFGLLTAVAEVNSEKAYHNYSHGGAVLGRSLKIWRSLQETKPDQFADSDYSLLAFAALGHDLYQDFKESGANEKASAIAVCEYTKDLYSPSDHERMYNAILATTVYRSSEGVITQQFIRKGSRDPLKLVLAMADINGIALEGTSRMLEDAVNLYLEINDLDSEVPCMLHSRSLGEFLKTQAFFLKTRLNVVNEDVAYYFPPDEDEQTYETICRQFDILFSNAYPALDLANWLAVPQTVTKITSYLSSSVASISQLPEQLIQIIRKNGPQPLA